MIRGTARFDGIAVGEATFSFLGTTVHLEAKAAFVNTKTGDTHGWTKNTNWTPAVIAKLNELRALMEADLGRLHMEGGGEVFVTTGQAARVVDDGEGGLGESLKDPTPQV